jgi:hypothetical protein
MSVEHQIHNKAPSCHDTASGNEAVKQQQKDPTVMPLHHAAQGCDETAVILLPQEDAAIKDQAVSGKAPSRLATEGKNEAMVEILRPDPSTFSFCNILGSHDH